MILVPVILSAAIAILLEFTVGISMFAAFCIGAALGVAWTIGEWGS